MTSLSFAPQYTDIQALEILLSFYGMNGIFKALPSERDQNWRVKTDDGTLYLLKIANQQEEQTVLEMQHEVMALTALAGVPVQEVILSLSGGEIMRTDAGYLVRLVSYLPGQVFAQAPSHSRELLHHLGTLLGKMDLALMDYDHPAAHREFLWDIRRADVVVERHIDYIQGEERRIFVEKNVQRYRALAERVNLRKSVIHNDANNYNLLVVPAPPLASEITGLIDFGDTLYSYTIGELAIACAYAMLNKLDPIRAAQSVIAGYHQILPLLDEEIDCLFTLINARLCTSVTLAAYQRSLNPENEYLSVSEKSAWRLLTQLETIHPELATMLFRTACGVEPNPNTGAIKKWLIDHRDEFGSLVDLDLNTKATILDLSVGSTIMKTPFDGDDLNAFTKTIFEEIEFANAEMGIGRYDEVRLLNQAPVFTADSGEQRNLHIGLDLFGLAGTLVCSPLDGTVHTIANNAGEYDYGPTIILKHDADGIPFYTLYRHLAVEIDVDVGQFVRRGDRLGEIGSLPENGNWTPHLHFQIIIDLLDYEKTFPGVVEPSQRETWLSLSPDPNLILNLDQDIFPEGSYHKSTILEKRQEHLGPMLSVSYHKPLKIVRGFRQYLYDENGRAYLDAVNNVSHVGHSHPHVVRAISKQAAVLNTNTRYLHDNLVRYAERLTATLPDPLCVCFFVNSGSEANDLALRMAKIYTGNSNIVVLDAAYHGNLSSLIDISPYKFDGLGGAGKPDHVEIAKMPDMYRLQAGPKGENYAVDVQQAIEAVHQRGEKVAAFIAESLLGCGGQIILPDNYLQSAYEYVHAAGGVCIADEVQVGFGRVGTHFWAFETQGVVPDIVTMGKPMGNGHPLAAVVTSPEIAAAFKTGMEYFNTFGGNPVSVAAGMAVLDVIEQEDLQQNALTVGADLIEQLNTLQEMHPIMGDVRGVGLFVGVELVLDENLTPAVKAASYIANRMKDEGVLISTDGPLHNVLKIKPPIIFMKENADQLVEKLGQILLEVNL